MLKKNCHQHCLESKKFKFLNLYIRNVKRNWGLLSGKKNTFLQNFQCSRARSICFLQAHHGTPYTMVRKNIGIDTEKLFFCLWWLILITHWLYLGAIKTGLPRAFWNGMTIGITPKKWGPESQICEINLFYKKLKNLQNSEIEIEILECQSQTHPLHLCTYFRICWGLSPANIYCCIGMI